MIKVTQEWSEEFNAYYTTFELSGDEVQLYIEAIWEDLPAQLQQFYLEWAAEKLGEKNE